MAFEKITDADLQGKGVVGQPDVPGLTALEMQEKIEEIVRAVVIPKVNGLIDDIVRDLATKEEVSRIVIEAGAVTSVFGRAGAVTAQNGDYTAEMVGAAPSTHKNQHKTGGADALLPSDIGAAAERHTHGNITNDGKVGTASGAVLMTGEGGAVEAKSIPDAGIARKVHNHGNITNDGKVGTTSGKVLMTGTGGAVEAKSVSDAGIAAKTHAHGNITNDGKVGSASGKVLMTGTGGAVEAVDKGSTGFVLPPTVNTGSTATTTLTLADNNEYVYTGVHALTINAGSGNGETWGQITFNSTANPTVTLSGFANVAGDDFTKTAASEVWEFSCKRKTILWKKVSA